MNLLTEPRRHLNQIARDEVVASLKARLQEAGYSLELGLSSVGRQRVSRLMPEPDMTLSVKHAEEPAVAAVHFAEFAGSFTYACTVLGAKGELAFERGRVNPSSGAVEILEARGALSDDD